jgi:hypothetical protein
MPDKDINRRIAAVDPTLSAGRSEAGATARTLIPAASATCSGGGSRQDRRVHADRLPARRPHGRQDPGHLALGQRPRSLPHHRAQPAPTGLDTPLTCPNKPQDLPASGTGATRRDSRPAPTTNPPEQEVKINNGTAGNRLTQSANDQG